MTGRDRMVARYTSLGWGELVSAVVFVGVAVLFVALGLARDGVPYGIAAALTPLVVILVQVGTYWLVARRWVLRGRMPGLLAAAYRTFLILNPVLLAAGLVVVAIWWPASWGWRLALMGIWAFGVVEYLNYYVVRLSYPPRRWLREVGKWRKPRLVQDMSAAR